MTNPIPAIPFAQRSLGDLVQADSRAARVLETFGLDFCCGGRRTLQEAADADGVPVQPIVDALVALGDPVTEYQEPAEWKDLDVLVQYIVEHHHAYVRQMTPALGAWLDRLVDAHGTRHPELVTVRQTFRDIADELASHMMKEENILFPFINDMAKAKRTGTPLPGGPFGTILNPVRVMHTEHARAGALLEQIRRLTNGMTPPADACRTYCLCYEELARFEQDLHRHVHLEEHVLFPQAVELEQDFA